MTVTVATFRATFPPFASDTTYTDPSVQFWLDLSAKLLDAERWGDLYDYGQQLFIAHNLTLEFSSNANASAGQRPGQVEGAVTSASVDKVSYGRDAASIMLPDAGHWNLSTYGIRYKQLVRMVGAGPIQVGADTPVSVSAAWPGPML